MQPEEVGRVATGWRGYAPRVLDVTASYTARAAEYVDLLGSMTAVHPCDRTLVETWADTVAGPILDVGCGPGHWTGHLAALGHDVRGVDRVPAFVEHARARHPDVRFDVGDMTELEQDDGALAGVLAWYSTIHLPPAHLAPVLAEVARVLRPGGGLVLGFFTGDAVERFPHAVAPAYRWPLGDVELLLGSAGFATVETHTRTGPDHRPHGAVIARLARTLPS